MSSAVGWLRRAARARVAGLLVFVVGCWLAASAAGGAAIVRRAASIPDQAEGLRAS